LRRCAGFIGRHLAAVKVDHTATEAMPIAMEALRIEGLKAIKKWRAWQAFKSADRIDSLAAFMYAKPDTGSVVLALPRIVPDDEIPDSTMARVLLECVTRISEAISEYRPRVEAMELAVEMVSLFETLTEKETEEPLVQLGAATCYALARIREGHLPERTECEGACALALGTREDYSEWRRQKQAATRARAAQLALRAAGREPSSELDILRPTDSQCPKCKGQTYLVEERIRRSDEPSDWFRLCPSCNTISRPKG